jgi:hypothetical protein
MLQRTIHKNPPDFLYLAGVLLIIGWLCNVVYHLTKPLKDMIFLDAIPIPDTYFYYAVSGVLLLIVVYFEVNHRKDTKDTLNKTTEILDRLVINDALRGQKIQALEEDVEGIKEKIFPINYKKHKI